MVNNMRVLSLFDGISCGQLALQRAGIRVEQYYASEISETARQVTQQHFPDTIQLGDVEKISIQDGPNIDLLIGGSPCQGFSFVGKQLAFNDPRSRLFFEYARILNECKPQYFLLENVPMKKQYQDVISSYLGVEPVKINSSVCSAQNRNRLYWTNISFDHDFPASTERFDNWLYRLGHGYVTDEIKHFEYYPSLAAQSPATKYRIVTDLAKAQNALGSDISLLRRDQHGITRSATPEECERFQTLPQGYTSCLPKTKRFHHIGNGWTVDVIAHIFRGLKKSEKNT